MINGKPTYTLYSKDDFAYSLFASINITDGTIQFWLIPTKDMLEALPKRIQREQLQKGRVRTRLPLAKRRSSSFEGRAIYQNDWQWTRDFQLGGKFPFPSRDDFEKYNQANPDSPLRLSFDDMNDMLAKIKEWDEEKNAKKKETRKRRRMEEEEVVGAKGE